MVQDPSIFSIIDWRAYFVMILFWFCLLFFVFYTSVSDSYLSFYSCSHDIKLQVLSKIPDTKVAESHSIK